MRWNKAAVHELCSSIWWILLKQTHYFFAWQLSIKSSKFKDLTGNTPIIFRSISPSFIRFEVLWRRICHVTAKLKKIALAAWFNIDWRLQGFQKLWLQSKPTSSSYHHCACNTLHKDVEVCGGFHLKFLGFLPPQDSATHDRCFSNFWHVTNWTRQTNAEASVLENKERKK